MSADATADICAHLGRWTEPGGRRLVVYRDTFMYALDAGARVADVLATYVLATGMTGVVRFTGPAKRARIAYLAPGAETVLEIYESGPWSDRVDRLREGKAAIGTRAP